MRVTTLRRGVTLCGVDEQPYALRQVTPSTRRRRWIWPVAVALVLVVGLAVGVLAYRAGSDRAPAATTAAGQPTAAATSARPAGPNDPAGTAACTEIRKVNADADLAGDPAVMERVAAKGQGASDTGLRVRSALLASQAQLAAAAKGQADEAAATVNMVTAGIELETACIQGRYYPSG